MKKLIALDIDGTVTHQHNEISSEVVEFLSEVYEKGYSLAFITGRNFDWGYQILKKIPVHYFFAVNNGAVILEMPERKILQRNTLDPANFPDIESICHEEGTDFIIYTGYEGGDTCYFRPHLLPEKIRDYLRQRTAVTGETWIPVESYNSLNLSSVASVKCFGSKAEVDPIAEKLADKLNLHVPVIRDPFDPSSYVAQATNQNATKGATVDHLKALLSEPTVVIAAGDDINDVTMLDAADFKIVMATAPDEVRALADYIAPPAAKDGIIDGIAHAIDATSRSE